MTSEAQKAVIIEQLWLTYYNDTLYAHGLLVESRYRAMQRAIWQRTRDKLSRLSTSSRRSGGTDCLSH